VTPAVAGTVQFLDGASALGSAVTVASGTAQKTVTFTSARTHSLTAQFTPSDAGTYAGSSGVLSYVVGKASSKTTATLPSRTPYGSAWTLHATVTSNVPPAGTVTVKNGSTVLASHALSAGKAALSIAGNALTVGKHTLTVNYGGASSVSAGSVSRTITVTKAVSKATNKLANATITRTQRGVLTVTVTAAGVVPIGKVTVFSGSTALKSVTLQPSNRGKVSITLPTLGVGRHQIHAAYAGSPTTAASTAPAVTLTITK
jgi:hypothetical protein